MKTIKKIFLLLTNIFICNYCFSQIVKTPFPITKLSWSEDNKVFSFSEDNNVFLRDSQNYQLLDSLNLKNVEQVIFSKEGNKQVLLTITKDGIFSIYDLKVQNENLCFVSKSPYFTKDFSSIKNITKIAFSENSDYIAMALNDNTINLIFKLRFSGETLQQKFIGHKEDIFNVVFSKDSNYLLSTSCDGTAIVWNCTNYKTELKLNVYSQTKVPAIFLNNNSKIIICDGKTSFSVYNLLGEKLISINTLHEIRKIKSMPDSNFVSILNNRNEIEIYDLEKKKWIGYIPECTSSIITDFEWNNDGSMILIGSQDGSIYKFILKEVLLNSKIQPKKIIKATSNSGVSRPVTESKNSFIFSSGVNYLNSPFLFSVNLDTQFRFAKNIEPCFFGFGLTGQLGFSRKNINREYYIEDKKIDSLNLLSGIAYIPFGIMFYPWDNDLLLLVIFKTGAKTSEVAILSDSKYIIDNPNITYFLSSGFGVIYNHFETSFNFEFDGIGKLSPSIYFGVSF